MDHMDHDVRCPKKAVLTKSLIHSLTIFII